MLWCSNVQRRMQRMWKMSKLDRDTYRIRPPPSRQLAPLLAHDDTMGG